MYRTAIRAVIGLVVVLDALTACGEAQPTNTPIPQPTATPTAAPEPAPPEPAATEPIEPEAEQSHLSKPGRFALFNQVWELVRDRYVYPDYGGLDWEAVKDAYSDRVIDAASDAEFYGLMHDMIEELGDDASSFVSPEQVAHEDSIYESLEIPGGIGAAVSEQDGEAVLVQVMPGYPADEAGLRPGERIVSVDGTATEELPGGVIPAIIGEAGTQLELTVRSLDGQERDVTLTRETVDLSDTVVEATTIEGTRIGLLELASFESPEIPGRVRNSLEELAKDGALEGLIVDLRIVQSGYADVALGVLALFLDGGSAGSGVGRDEVFAFEIPAGETVPELTAVPVVVLTGPHTLSTGEGFAAIMQHYGRAQIAGLPTRGNTEIVFPYALSDGSMLLLADGVYQLPDGTMFEGRGVQPDLVVEGDPWQVDVADDPQIQAAIEALRSD